MPGAPRASASGSAACTSATTSCGRGACSTPHPTSARQAILEHNALIAEDERYVSTIVPTRDGVLVAVRIR